MIGTGDGFNNPFIGYQIEGEYLLIGRFERITRIERIIAVWRCCTGRQQHHSQKQHQCIVVHGPVSLLRSENPARNHHYRSQQGRRGAIQRQDFQLPATDEQVCH
jgi:hypothetical protein